MKIFQKAMGFFKRFETKSTCPNFFLFPFLFIQTAIKLSNLADLGLIDIFIAELRCNSFGVSDASI